jgi:hypothetical protein
MGYGTYQMTSNVFVAVQATMLTGCVPTPTISCIRSVTVGIKDWNNPTVAPDLVSYGYWGTYDSIYVVSGGVATTYTAAQVTANPVTTSEGAVVTYDPSTARVSVQQTLGTFAADGTYSQWTVTIGAYYLVVALPIGEGFYESHGLCGYFNNNPLDDMTDSDGNLLVPNTQGGQRYDGGDVNVWGAKYAVYAGGPIAPLAHFHYATNPLTNEVYVTDTPATPSYPDPINQTLIEQLNISLAELSAIEAQCSQITNDSNAYQNCIYDYAQSGDVRIAQSNLLAAATKDAYTPTSNTVLTQGEIAGVVLGSFAGVACILAIGTYVKLHQAKKQYNQLIVSNRNSRGAAQAPAGTMPSL